MSKPPIYVNNEYIGYFDNMVYIYVIYVSFLCNYINIYSLLQFYSLQQYTIMFFEIQRSILLVFVQGIMGKAWFTLK